MFRFILIWLFLGLTANSIFSPTIAAEAAPVASTTVPNSSQRIIKVDEEKKQIVVEINGKVYSLDLNQAQEVAEASLNAEKTVVDAGTETRSETSSAKADTTTAGTDYAELEKQFAALNSKNEKYTGLPAVTGSRLYTLQTDRLAKKGHFGLDFTHRFSSSFGQENDLFGFDGFAYNSVGVQYGLLDKLELHAMRANIGDSYEVGVKAKLLQETKKFSLTNPFNVTLHSGFQNDNMQNSMDPYLQLILSRSIIPNRVQFYTSPIYAWRTNSINSGGSSSAIYSESIDKNGFKRGNDGTMALPLGISLEVLKNRAALVGELIPVIGGFHENNMGWSTAFKFLSKRETHIWTMGLSNMPYVTTVQAIVGGPDDHLHLGFNVEVFL